MRNVDQRVLFIQGGGENAWDWDAKLAQSLERKLGPGFSVVYPKMPDESNPNYPAWKACMLDELEKLGDGTILVGHSMGGSMLIKMLAETCPPVSLEGIVLISAPFMREPGGWDWKEAELPANAGERLPKDVPLLLYHGEADEEVPFAHLALYAKAFPKAVTRALAGRNHQLNDDLTEVADDIRKL